MTILKEKNMCGNCGKDVFLASNQQTAQTLTKEDFFEVDFENVKCAEGVV